MFFSITRRFCLFLMIIAASAVMAGCMPSQKPVEPITAPEPLPFSDKIVYGELDNGVKYYIRHNDFPPQKVELRLNVRSGSLNETEEERGIAHFVEHMAFNGTVNFDGNDLIRYMESVGLTFGQHTNAYTNTNNTNFKLSVPSDNATLLDETFSFIRDWADGIVFDPDEIESEKGVITEEWRSRNTSSSRLGIQSRRYMLAGSLYPDRDPIGDMDVVAGANRDLVKGYYDKWYTPENISVIVVGDIDPAEAETLIKKYFSPIEPRRSPAAADTRVPLTKGFRTAVISDPELTSTSFSLMFFEPEEKTGTYEALRKNTRESVALAMFNKRISLKILEKRVDLLGMRANKSVMNNGLGVMRVNVTTRPATMQTDIDTVLTEIERVKRYGFTDNEVNEVRTAQMTALGRAAKPDYKYPSDKYADQITSYDTYGGYLTEFWQDEELMGRVFASSTTEDYRAAFNAMFDTDSILALVMVPDSEKEQVSLDQAGLMAAFKRAGSADIKPDTKSDTIDALIKNIPSGGKVASRTEYDNIGGTLVQYDNGIRLFIRPSRVEKNRYIFTAKKPGGMSIMSDEDVVYADFATKALAASGFDNITRRQLTSFMVGKQAGVSTGISEYSFDMSGGGDKNDIVYTFQLLHLWLTSPDVDPDTFDVMISNTSEVLKGQEKDKKTVFNRDTSKIMNNSAYRRQYITSQDLPALKPDRLLNIYESGFMDAAGWVFVVSGDVDTGQVIELGRVYLGGLKAEGHPAAKDRGVRLREKTAGVQGYGDVENRSTVTIRFENDAEYYKNGQYAAALLRRVLNQRLRENIREDMGGAYSVSFSIGYTDYPSYRFSGRVSLTCDPARKDEIIARIMQVLNDAAAKGVTADELNVAKTLHYAQLDTVSKQNDYWANNISYYLVKGEPLQSVDEVKSIIGGLTLEDINTFARTYMTDINVFTMVFNPEQKND